MCRGHVEGVVAPRHSPSPFSLMQEGKSTMALWLVNVLERLAIAKGGGAAHCDNFAGETAQLPAKGSLPLYRL